MNERFKQQCVEETDVPQVKCEEKKKVMIFKNDNRISLLKVHVDGCQIDSNNEWKCDYLVVNPTDGNEYYVELKGKDVDHALEQLDNTITLLTDKANKTKEVRAFVVSTNGAPKVTTKAQRGIKKLKSGEAGHLKKHDKVKVLFGKNRLEYSI